MGGLAKHFTPWFDHWWLWAFDSEIALDDPFGAYNHLCAVHPDISVYDAHDVEFVCGSSYIAGNSANDS